MAEAEKYAYADRSEYLLIRLCESAVALTHTKPMRENAGRSNLISQTFQPDKPGKLALHEATRPPTSRWWIKTAMPWR
ncbi:hypothetical protein KCP77_03620 [Salmonella enterica subsp. enterica]|nr:hypothetical protein KCP77_03620 [Salmonella enterica subsp. enterica]